MTKKVYIVLIWALLTKCFSDCPLHAQSRTDTLQKIKELIIKHSTVSPPGIGLFFSPSKYWYASGYMIYIVTNEELVSISKDKNIALKVYSYLGLHYINHPASKSVMKKLIKEKELVNTFFGCVANRKMSIKKCLKYFTQRNNYLEWMTRLQNSLLTDKEYRNKLFQSLIEDKNDFRPPSEKI